MHLSLSKMSSPPHKTSEHGNVSDPDNFMGVAFETLPSSTICNGKYTSLLESEFLRECNAHLSSQKQCELSSTFGSAGCESLRATRVFLAFDIPWFITFLWLFVDPYKYPSVTISTGRWRKCHPIEQPLGSAISNRNLNNVKSPLNEDNADTKRDIMLLTQSKRNWDQSAQNRSPDKFEHVKTSDRRVLPPLLSPETIATVWVSSPCLVIPSLLPFQVVYPSRACKNKLDLWRNY